MDMTLAYYAKCFKILKKSLRLTSDENIKILRYSVNRCSDELVGFMGEYYKLNICIVDEDSVDGEKKFRYFIKTVPLTNEYHRDECERKGFFEKEGCIYTEILPNIQRYAPTQLYPECYYNRPDLLVLEDLSASPKGFHHIDNFHSHTPLHHKVMLKHLAKLHAASIAWESYENINIGEKFQHQLKEMFLSTENEWYITGVKSIVFLSKMLPSYQEPRVKKYVDEELYEVLCKAELLTEPSKKFHNVLCHRDSWEHNIFYTYNEQKEPIDCRIVDFQLTRYSPPAIDVLFFIYATTTFEEREKTCNTYLEYYHESLRASLRNLNLSEDLITMEEFQQDCKRARFPVLILHSISEPLIKMPKGVSNKMRAEEQEKFDYYMNTKRDELFLRVIEMEPTYRKTILQPVEELLNYLLKNDDLFLS
ncbi:uncharacterized protein LOC119688296 [Teleopsis dalmanni]|uniref:uncharacterized protein LOC119688296 n=1 Tax=Teleopsis dalmanni TaxID=139649 RepID=UPI0018CEC2C6|nr:uncharacterized protein LOC119688296 [Teleopsis dalmanni]